MVFIKLFLLAGGSLCWWASLCLLTPPYEKKVFVLQEIIALSFELLLNVYNLSSNLCPQPIPLVNFVGILSCSIKAVFLLYLV